jgi:mevalonate kinase
MHVQGHRPDHLKPEGRGYGAGKVILLGEHAVVYGRPALAAGLPDGIELRLRPSVDPIGRVRCAGWGLDLPLDAHSALGRGLLQVLSTSGLEGAAWDLEIDSKIPPSSGLGSSAALCVAAARAAADLQGRPATDAQVAEVALAGERCFHGTPSGIDNTVAAFGGLLWFRKPEHRRRIPLAAPLTLVIAHSGRQGETAAQVALVRRRYDEDPGRYEKLFDEMGGLVDEALEALAAPRMPQLGSILDRAHRYLQTIGVSCEALDEIVSLSRGAGALGAKLTGAGGGGCAIALCPGSAGAVVAALERKGYPSFVREIR